MRLRAIATLAVAILAAVFFSPAAHSSAAPRALDYPPTTCPGALSVSTTHPLPGETITVTGHNFSPGGSVHLVLRPGPYDLGTFQADAQGSFTAHVKLPDGVVGRHVVVAVSGAPHIAQCAGAVIQIQAGGESTGPGGPPGTSFTGIDLLLILLAAAVLIAAGVLFVRSGKRRHGYSEPV